MSDISDIRNHFFATAETWWAWSLLAAVLVPSVSIVSLWSTMETFVGAAAAISIVSPILIVWMRELSTENQVKGDRCRRLILYADGLGISIAEEDLAQVWASSLGARLKAARFTAPYYSSKKTPGAQRLADIVAESAFFTEHLAAKLSGWGWGASITILACAALTLHLADFAKSDSDAAVNLAKSVAIVISFLIAGDFFLIKKKFSDLKNSAHETLIQCARMRNTESTSADVVRIVVEDYGIALLQAPPIPSWLYELYQEDLNRIYRASHYSSEPTI